MNEKERLCNGGNDSESIAERFRIYDDQLSKFEQLRAELNQKEKLISDLQQVVNSSKQHLQSNNMQSPVSYINMVFSCDFLSYIYCFRLWTLKKRIL